MRVLFCEIHETAQDAGTVKQLLRVAEEEKLDIPEKLLTMSTYDLALWLYIHTEEKVWDRIVRFIYADRWSDSMWLVSNLEDAPNDPDWKRPEISVLEKAISSHIVSHELRGQHVEIIHEQRDDNNEYFFVYFNDYRTSKSIYTDEGAFNHNAINRDAKIMLFWIQHDQRRINARIEKMDSRRKKELCDLVTKTMLNCHIQGRKKRILI